MRGNPNPLACRCQMVPYPGFFLKVWYYDLRISGWRFQSSLLLLQGLGFRVEQTARLPSHKLHLDSNFKASRKSKVWGSVARSYAYCHVLIDEWNSSSPETESKTSDVSASDPRAPSMWISF